MNSVIQGSNNTNIQTGRGTFVSTTVSGNKYSITVDEKRVVCINGKIVTKKKGKPITTGRGR